MSATLNLDNEDEEESQKWTEEPEPITAPEISGLRRRLKGKKRRLRGFKITSDMEDTDSSICEDESPPRTPRDDQFPSHLRGVHYDEVHDKIPVHGEVAEEIGISSLSSVLPQYAVDTLSVQYSLSSFEWCLDRMSPYSEMNEASSEEDYEKVLGRLLTEWYVVGASVCFLYIECCSQILIILYFRPDSY